MKNLLLFLSVIISCEHLGTRLIDQSEKTNSGQRNIASFPRINLSSPQRDHFYDERKRRDDDRREVLDRSYTRRSGNICEKEDRDHECKDQCKEIYRRIRDRDDCEELTVSQVEGLYRIFTALESPVKSQLRQIDPEDFDVFLNISIAALEDLIDDWSSREAKEFLYWLINNEDAATVFEKEDDDYDTLTALLRKVRPFNFTNIHEPFITGRFIEVAVNSGNEKVIEWFMEYIEDKNNACGNETVSKACFTVYCKIGNRINKNAMKSLMGFDSFASYIEDIVDDKINATNGVHSNVGTGWTYGDGNGEYEDSGDITDNWVKDLCGDLT